MTDAVLPDWESTTADIICPLCEYNLRGLTEPRCPECGYTFQWDEILDPNRRLHPYLFEHHPERRAWSFFKTFFGGLRPRRFWRSLHPVQPSHLRRLIAYVCLIVGLYLGILAVQLMAVTLCTARETIAWARAVRPTVVADLSNPRRRRQAQRLTAQYGSIQAYLDVDYPVTLSRKLLLDSARKTWRGRGVWALALIPLFWPPSILMGLILFRISMRRVRINTVHVLRCVLYNADVLLWLAFTLALCSAASLIAHRAWSPRAFEYTVLIGLWGAPVVLLIYGYRLVVAYRLYLRFDHPVSTVLAAHFVAGLLVLNCVVIIYLLTGWRFLAGILSKS